MTPTTLADRLTVQLAPAGALVNDVITDAYSGYSIKAVALALPNITRDAHRARVSGLLVWQHVADGLVAAVAAGRLPDGWAVVTSEKQHNSGRYLLRFPGGVMTIRRAPHDDEKDEGQFMQESFAEITEALDKAAMPDERELARVWLKIAPNGASLFAAEDRHGYTVKVPLLDLLAVGTQPAAGPSAAPGTTQVRSRLRSAEQSDAQ
jgi:hypothetical protein